MLVILEIHLLAAKGNAFQFKAQALFGGGFEAQFDFSSGTDDALPWQGSRRNSPKEARYRPVVQRISSRGGHLPVGGDLALGDGEDHASKCRVAKLAGLRALLGNAAGEGS